MFTDDFLQKTEQGFNEQMSRLGAERTRVEELLKKCTRDEAEALKCLYASMPVSDAADYPPELFYSYARHGVFLWKEGPFAGKIPEDIFAGYVLHHRVNNEDLAECRSFFYEELKDRIYNRTMEKAVLEVNYWCASKASYRTTDERTASALSVYRSGYGRCGEESTFAVSVLRSVGIPARQVYVPWWSHCDDNHAWVEVWCEGTWKFLGACEPEEILNKGWFTNASSRAMMVHSRWMLPVSPKDDLVGRKGMALVTNQLATYAKTAGLEVTVEDEEGNAVSGAQLKFEVMNYACYGEIASGITDKNGKAVLETGLGTVHVTACKDGAYAETTVHMKEKTECTLRLGEFQETPDVWEDKIIYAPEDAPVNRVQQPIEEVLLGRKKFQKAAEERKNRENHFYRTEEAEKALACVGKEFRDRGREILYRARGNQGEIAEFLMSAVEDTMKMNLLNSLREKDYIDITAKILEETCIQAEAYADQWSEDIFVPYVLCPRVADEMIRPFRTFIGEWLSEYEKEQICIEPKKVWELVNRRIQSDERLEYGNLIMSARGALTSGYGSVLTKRVVSVQILRTLGIPARLNPSDHVLEIWNGEKFETPEQEKGEQRERTSTLLIQGEEGENWIYFQNWTIARFEKGEYHTLRLSDESGEEIYGEIPLFPGKYRILTANRLPNGNIFAKQMVFELREGEKREILLELKKAQVEDMLEHNDVADFSLRKGDGTERRLSELTEKNKGLFLWLEEGQEPTEHILNEIYQRKEAYGSLGAKLYFIVKDIESAAEYPQLKRVLELNNAEILQDEFGADMEILARRMYLEPGRLPLIVIIDEERNGIYGIAGYNVGTADMILKILNMQEEKRA